MLILKTLLPIVARTVLCIATFFLLPVAACGETAPSASTASAPPKKAAVTPEQDKSPPETDLETIDVELDVRTDFGEPIVGRPVVLLDAAGKAKERLTDEGGLVHFARVRAPYDLMVAAAPSGVMLVPTVVLGLSRRDPVIELYERDGSPVLPPAETVRVAVAPPPCRAPACSITVATGSAHGAGSTSVAYAGAPKPIVITLDHEWNVAVLPKDEMIDVHVLTSDEPRTTYAYARYPGLTATPGEKRDIGTLAPEAIASTSEVTIATHVAKADIDQAWDRTLATWLDLPGGGTMLLSYREGAEGKGTALRLPLLPLPGATLRVQGWAYHPMIESTVPFGYSLYARSGEKKVATDPIDVDLMLGPTLARPTFDGRLSRRGLGFEWRNELAGTFLYALTVSDLGRGHMRFRVYTNATSFTLGRLESLGLPKLMTGLHVLELATTEGSTTDDMTSPDETQRRRGRDESRSARVSYQRIGFNVMP